MSQKHGGNENNGRRETDKGTAVRIGDTSITVEHMKHLEGNIR